MTETLFFTALVGVIALLAFLTIRDRRRARKQRQSLRQGSDGTYYWVDHTGTQRSATKHPDQDGGAWHDASGGGGGDGGGGGGGD